MGNHKAAIDLLIFRVKGSRFGLDVAQIGEILRLQELELHRESAGGICFIRREGTEIPVVEMTALIGMEESVPDENAKLVLPRSAASEVGFLIGEPEEIVQVEARDIELLPPLIRPMVRGSGMWGMAKREEGLVILIDLVEAAEGIAV